MKKNMKKLKKNKFKFTTSLIIMAIMLMANLYLGYAISLLSGIETVLRISVFVVTVIIFLIFLLFSLKQILEKNKIKYIILTTIQIVYIIAILLVSFNINKVYSKLSVMGTSSTFYTSSIITKEVNEVDKVKDIDSGTIGILSNENSIEGHIIPLEFIKQEKLKNKTKTYESFIELLEALEDDEVEYAFVPGNYKIMFSEIESIAPFLDETKVIHSVNKEIESLVKKRDLDKPFTILIMGVDSENENIKGSSFNGDALMVLTFNPKTLNSTILSIPRDTYVPIACFKGERKNKITHAAWYGENCMMDTIEGFLDVEIDYFLKINFKGVVNLVDSLGGIDVNVPYSFCEQNSDRKWGKDTVFVKEGLQTLNGEQALALSRNRKDNGHICGSEWGTSGTNDFVRGQNQQLVIGAMLEKMKNVRSVDKLYDLLDDISNSMETNMSTNEMLSFYNIGKDILSMSKDEKVADILNIQRLYISGYDQYIIDYSQIHSQGSRNNLYNFVPYKGSLKDISSYMKTNLGLEKNNLSKKITFDANVPYKATVIGKGYYNETSLPLLPSFIGDSESEVRSYASRHGISVEVTKVSKTGNYQPGEVLSQFPYSGMDLSYVNKLKIEVVDKVIVPETPTNTEVDCYIEENANNSACMLPNFEGMTYEKFNNLKSKYKLTFDVIEITTDSSEYDESKAGLIVSQDKKNESIYNLKDTTITIMYEAQGIQE